MERLTMYEVIEHCKRKVQKTERLFRKEHLEQEECFANDVIFSEYWEHRQVAEWLEELKAYKDAEEQGLLLRLPCVEGTDCYMINEYYSFGEVGDKPLLLHSIYAVKFNRTMIEQFGKTVFLTKEDAEKALEDMKGGAV